MIRIVKKNDTGIIEKYIIRVIAVILALVVSSGLILIMDKNPVDVYKSMVEGAFGTKYRFLEVVIKTIPLVITSIGISVAFKMKFWNIGAEGQIMMGGFAASFVALNFKALPQPFLLLMMFVAAVIGGGVWGLIPAYFRAKFRTNETIFTLMMNYIAIKWVTYLQYGPWKDPNALGFPKIPAFTENAVLPKLLGVHIGWIIALILVVIAYIFMHYTKKGYEIDVVGESENTAVYAGMNVKKIIITAMLISGGICGIAGMVEVSGVHRTLSMELSGGVGYTAIITAWLSGLSAPFILVVSFLFAAMVQGGSYIQMVYFIPQSAAQLLQGMILFFILGSEFFIKYRFKIDKEGGGK